MMVQCRKCGRKTEIDEITAQTACPGCGAVYAKMNAAAQQAEKAQAAEEKAAAAKAAAEQAKAEKTKLAIYHRQVEENLSKWLCLACGTFMLPKKSTNGSFGVEISLWLVGFLLSASIIFLHFGAVVLLIAFVYSCWRIFGRRRRVCSTCKSEQIIPASSPKGREELGRRGMFAG